MYILLDVSKDAVTTCIRVRPDVLSAMRKLAEIKRAQAGGFGRASVSHVLSDLAVAELARVEAQAKRKRGRVDA
jgi:hypothetical protein